MREIFQGTLITFWLTVMIETYWFLFIWFSGVTCDSFNNPYLTTCVSSNLLPINKE